MNDDDFPPRLVIMTFEEFSANEAKRIEKTTRQILKELGWRESEEETSKYIQKYIRQQYNNYVSNVRMRGMNPSTIL